MSAVDELPPILAPAKRRAVVPNVVPFPSPPDDPVAEYLALEEARDTADGWADKLQTPEGVDRWQHMRASPGFECYQRMLDTQDRYHALQKHPAVRQYRANFEGRSLACSADEPEHRIVKPFVEGLIDRGEVGVMAGHTGTFKTQDAIELAIATILDKPWKGRKVHHTGPVLYLALEDRAAVRQIRLPAAMDALSLTPEERARVLAWFCTQPPGASVKLPEASNSVNAMLEDVEELTGEICVLVVVDTIREALPGSVSSEKDAGPFLDCLFGLAAGGGPTVLAIGHVNKEDARKPLAEQSPKGLGDFLDRAAFVLMKGGGTRTGTTELHVLKAKNHPRDYSIHFKLEPGPRGIPVQHASEKTKGTPIVTKTKGAPIAENRKRGRPRKGDQL